MSEHATIHIIARQATRAEMEQAIMKHLRFTEGREINDDLMREIIELYVIKAPAVTHVETTVVLDGSLLAGIAEDRLESNLS